MIPITNRVTGVVKFFNESRGYGFIKPSVNSHDVFYHFTALTPGVTPRDGDSCTYVLGEGRNGKSAAFDIKLVAAAGTNDTNPSAAEAGAVFGGLNKFLGNNA